MQTLMAQFNRVPPLHTRTLLIYVVFTSIFWLNVFGFTDPDFWWHLRTGQYIFETCSIPKVDMFSYTSAGEPWITHEWASQVLLFLLFRAFGYAGDVILMASIVTLAFFFIFRLCLKLGINDLLAVLLVFWGAMLVLLSLTVRPLIFTWLFFSIFLMSLYLYHRQVNPRLWHLPPLMVIWVNLHAGFAIGLALIGLLVGTMLGEGLLMKKPLAVRHPLIVLALSALAALANPNGFRGLIYPLSYLGTTNPSMHLITEWQSPNFHEPSSLLLLASFLLLISFGVAYRGLGSWPLLLTALLITIALQSVRNIPLYALAMAPIMGEVLKVRFERLKWTERQLMSRTLGRWNWLILILLTASAFAVAVRSPFSQLREMPLQLREVAYPIEGANYVRVNHPQSRLFNEYVWGGYLIYNLFPTQRVFIDGRADVHGQKLLNEYTDVVYLKPNWEEILDRYEVDLVFIKKDSPLSVLLTASSSWDKAFTGEIEDIYVRRSTRR